MNTSFNILSPKNFEAMSVDERREFIENYMTSHFLGKSFYCPALGKQVRITMNSIKETASHASKKVESVHMTLNLPYVIENACLVYKSDPKSGVQTKKFKAIKTLVLFTLFSIGSPVAKLTIVEKANNYYVEYCITAQENFATKMLQNAFSKLDGELVLIQKRHLKLAKEKHSRQS